MKVKLWIIYKENIGFSRMIAEMLQDRLEDFRCLGQIPLAVE